MRINASALPDDVKVEVSQACAIQHALSRIEYRSAHYNILNSSNSHEILGAKQGDDEEAIKRAYKRRIILFHEANYKGDDRSELLKRINIANDHLRPKPKRTLA